MHAPAPGGEPALRPRVRCPAPPFWAAACACIIVVGSLMGAMLITFPKRDEERRLLASYHAEDVVGPDARDPGPAGAAPEPA
jgi:hypothetical protein